MPKIAQQILVWAFVIAALSVCVTTLILFYVETQTLPSAAAPSDDAGVKLAQARFQAAKLRMEVLLLPIDRMLSLLQMIAAAILLYIFGHALLVRVKSE